MEKLYENTRLKLNTKISILMEKYQAIEFDLQNLDWKKNHITFNCNEHGSFTLTALEIRMGKICPECKISHKEKLIEQYKNSGREERQVLITKEFKTLDWSEVKYQEYLDLDHTIRPNCFEHGEFITTPRKLLTGDTCKWCDGIHLDDDQNYNYKLSRTEFLKEKIQIVNGIELVNGVVDLEEIKIPNNEKYLYKNKLGNLKDLKNNQDYVNHLKEVRDPACWNSILFKINIMDKSTKFQFTVVSRINLTEPWVNWYKEYIQKNPDEVEEAQYIATTKIIDSWYNMVFYNRPTPELKDPFQYEIVWSFWSNQRRIDSLYYKYRVENQSKLMTLASSLQDKIFYNLEDVKVNCYWSDIKWESTSTSVSLIRETILKKTDICPICKKTINKPVVDHEHKKKVKGTGRIRDNICSNCNVFIAKAENNCKRYGIILEELPEVLKNVSDYFTQQQYNIIHYTDKDARPVLSKTLANKILKYWDCIFPKKKKLKFPRSGILTKDWEEAIKAYEEYLKVPAKPFSKNDYKVLLRNIEIYNTLVTMNNEKLPKTKKVKLLEIPEYPKLKLITPEIQTLMDMTKLEYK